MKELAELSNKSNFKQSAASQKQRIVARDSHLQNAWEKLLFLCEIAPYGKSSIPILEEVLPSTEKKNFERRAR